MRQPRGIHGQAAGRVGPRRPLARVGLLALVALAGCGEGDADSERTGGSPEPSGQLERIVVAAGEAPRTLDAAKARLAAERIIASAIQTPLLTHPHRTGDDAAALVPALALDLPRLTDDRLEYRFTLRPGLVYADGRLVKASDVERAIAHASKVAADPELRDVLRSVVGAPSADGQTLRGVRTDDRNGAVVVRLREPDGRIPLALADPATAPLPELPSGQEGALPASTGPLRVARLTENSVELVANPLRARIDSVPAARTAQIAIVGNGSSFDVSRGEVDVAVQGGATGGLRDPSKATSVVAPAGTVWALLVPTTGAFSSRPVREALAKAVDRRPFREARSSYRAACSLLPSWIVGATPQDDCPPVPTASKSLPLLGERVRVSGPPHLILGTDLPSRTTPPTTPTGEPALATQPRSPLAAAARALESLGATVATRHGGLSPQENLAQGRADVALVRIRPSLPHPAEYLAPIEPLDTLVGRQTPLLTARPLTGASGKWSALERRALARAVAIPIAGEVDAATVGASVEPRSVVLHPVLGLDLAALRLR